MLSLRSTHWVTRRLTNPMQRFFSTAHLLARVFSLTVEIWWIDLKLLWNSVELFWYSR